MLAIRVAAEAEAEIAAELAYRTGQPNTDPAQWFNELERTLIQIRESPNRFSPYPESSADLFGVDFREAYFGAGRRRTHRVIFQVLDGLVVVMRVRHMSQRPLDLDELRSQSD